MAELQVRKHQGAQLLDTLAGELDRLHERTATPVTARLPWLRRWVACFPHVPFAVTVEDAGEIVGAALLARTRTRGLTRVVAMGDGPSDMIRLPVASPEVAPVLARGVRDALATFPRPWWLTLAQLPEGDPVAAALARGLRYSHTVPAEGAPVTRIGEDRNKRSYVSRSHHKHIRRMSNRMRRDGVDPKIELFTSPEDIVAAWPDIERLARARDEHLGVPSKLDDPSMAPFIRQVVIDHAELGEVEVATLRLQGELAAYVVAFLDGDAYRMWSGRLNPGWKRYAPGRHLDDALLRRVVEDTRFSLFDFMKGEEDYKDAYTNDMVPAETLHAFSGRALERVWWGARRAKDALRPHVHRHEGLHRTVLLVKRMKSAAGRKAGPDDQAGHSTDATPATGPSHPGSRQNSSDHPQMGGSTV